MELSSDNHTMPMAHRVTYADHQDLAGQAKKIHLSYCNIYIPKLHYVLDRNARIGYMRHEQLRMAEGSRAFNIT